MTIAQQIITVALCMLATMLTRFIPFLLFRDGKIPPYIRYIGHALPASMFSLLLVYCLKGVDIASGSRGLPEALSILATWILFVKTKQTLLPIALGTALYMLLIQFVF